MAGNVLVQTKTAELEGPDGPAVAITIALNVEDPANAREFVAAVVENFKTHRMMAPPETSILLVSIIGALPAKRFAQYWDSLAEQDPVLKAFMSRMSLAQAVQGTATGKMLGAADLAIG